MVSPVTAVEYLLSNVLRNFVGRIQGIIKTAGAYELPTNAHQISGP